MKQMEGGVTAAKGFTAAGVHCGVKSKNSDKKDLAIILSSQQCSAAAVYTRNQVKAAPIYVTKEHLKNGNAWGIVANSGNANACAPYSHENAEAMSEYAAAATGRKAEDFVVASTGVIGQTLNIAAIQAGMPNVVQALNADGSDAAAQAIMTTDTKKKECAVSVEIGGKSVTIGAIAKGSGMIHPNMGTMLAFVTSDCSITPACLQKALSSIVCRTFNRVTVDGDTSTNDMCVVLANGMAENPLIDGDGENYDLFYQALSHVCEYLSKSIAADGEGASRLVTCTVSGAKSEEDAEGISKSIVSSSLLKAAMFGADANWGRVLCAMGYSGVTFDPEKVDVKFCSDAGEVLVCQSGTTVDFDETVAKTILSRDEVTIQVELHEGGEQATCWGCDLTYDYVKINGDYRS